MREAQVREAQVKVMVLCVSPGFTTLTYLRVHAQKHHGQEWKESGGVRGGGVLLCQLCGVQCKTATQLQGHMGTHAAPPPTTSSSPSPSTGGGASMSVTVTSDNSVALLVSDCSGINTSTIHTSTINTSTHS